MGFEIERKFLTSNYSWMNAPGAEKWLIRQGYLSIIPDSTIRVRYESNELQDIDAYITIKGKLAGITRVEFEYNIPPNDALDMLQGLCSNNLLVKHRWYVPYGANTWHIDVFEGKNKGLVVAEIELETEEQLFDRPNWLSTEITHDIRYSNSNLAVNPWSQW